LKYPTNQKTINYTQRLPGKEKTAVFASQNGIDEYIQKQANKNT
jgi:hypothetical protein